MTTQFPVRIDGDRTETKFKLVLETPKWVPEEIKYLSRTLTIDMFFRITASAGPACKLESRVDIRGDQGHRSMFVKGRGESSSIKIPLEFPMLPHGSQKSKTDDELSEKLEHLSDSIFTAPRYMSGFAGVLVQETLLTRSFSLDLNSDIFKPCLTSRSEVLVTKWEGPRTSLKEILGRVEKLLAVSHPRIGYGYMRHRNRALDI
ncbi:hypothetical protein TREMEDRAFT_65102 [Tremella mesenterica DSM 1558]|uniref:uncharacterized protein n=1 Tax=Tremella mesenterica (strain ATCC 24925 / CBS 8224 / DSM 1558 / NBRC 9311 / NRRL Y-6157 / RJB 2259-6 / UBC 559-6) TaxID=578456 RepID=UPI00032D1DFE|nr:uncharacterized protein TREMEDRAFT_65102 [Tremella mesenterica DSM 1558]EIW66708.1 hypothetical protein TREMEDRAFT_65102 [Tremella mesenterica DSM 1558]